MRALHVLLAVAILAVAGCSAPIGTGQQPTDTTDTTAGSTTDETPTRTVGTTTAGTTDGTTTAGTTTGTTTADDPSDGDGSEDDPGSDDDGAVAGDVPPPEALPVNDTETFANLTEMLGVDAERPTLGTQNLSRYFQSRETTQLVLLGLEEYVENPEDDPHGLATPQNQIYVQPAGAHAPIIEQVVVHEQFHAIQFQQGWTGTRRPATTDGRLAQSGAIEGAAVWITGEYTERYQGEAVPRQVQMVRDAVVNGPDGYRVFRAPYYFGARWTEHHLDEPANVSWVYENPPVTTEQLMHNMTADTEPVRDVDLTVRAGEYRGTASDRLGEAYVWATLRGELDADRARTTAAGWGGDQIRMVYGPDGETSSLAWAIRWDSTADADEFEAAAVDWIAERDADASFNVVRVNETVTLLLAGDDAFVDAAVASIDNGTVVVEYETTTETSDGFVARWPGHHRPQRGAGHPGAPAAVTQIGIGQV